MQEISKAKLGLYLKRLREGYGYTLRKVEEKADKAGYPIDNSQISRFEQGRAIPSFEKLKILAQIFNISIQNFSDVMDLSQYELYKPDSNNYQELLQEGEGEYKLGNFGHAYATFEKALEVAEAKKQSRKREEYIVEAKMRMATALKALGRLSLSEAELRSILRNVKEMPIKTRLRVLLQLSYVNRELGEFYLAEVLAQECLRIASEEKDEDIEAAIFNTLGNIAFDEERHQEAIHHYERSLLLLRGDSSGKDEMVLKVMVNLGGSYIANGDFSKGMKMINESLAKAKENGYSRTAALSLTRMGEAYILKKQFHRARRCLRESDMLSDREEGKYSDILFLNTYRQWEIAQVEKNRVQEKIYFRRLKQLRSQVERRFPEIVKFDHFIEKVGEKNAKLSH
jgi:transcriptional regulator with XRE-family HTH domain